MEDGKTNDEGNEEGKETPITPEETQIDNSISPLDRAEKVNREKAELLKQEAALLERKEKIIAAEAVGGRARAGQIQIPREEDIKKNQAKEFFKGTALEGAIDNL